MEEPAYSGRYPANSALDPAAIKADHQRMGCIAVPDHLNFAHLDLEREPVTHRLLFVPGPLAELCRFNGLDPAVILADEDLPCWTIAKWYFVHIMASGELDAVAEQILADLADSTQAGATFEH